ncbi:unannotated protein [freshwater metagenome]|uniref:Unannotated protein n=1 Tax=freshwater metagenome TaxID=449393 RepID=A0A6J6A145_9ZZZZ
MHGAHKGRICLGTHGIRHLGEALVLKHRNDSVLHRTNAVVGGIDEWLRKWQAKATKEIAHLIAICSRQDRTNNSHAQGTAHLAGGVIDR